MATRRKMNYDRFLNERGKRREQSGINNFSSMLHKAKPGSVNLCGGQNNPKTFIIDNISLNMRDGSQIKLDSQETAIGMNYCISPGLTRLSEWCEKIVKHQNNPPLWGQPPEEGGTKVMVANGSIDTISKVLENMVSKGDKVIVEDIHFETQSLVLTALQAEPIAIEMDQYGMLPGSLRKVMSQWKPEDAKNPNSGIPKLLCTVPNGHNPTGVCTPMDRRREIYKICQEYDMMIFEDDALWQIDYNDVKLNSYLSMDVDGRVIRSDTFSKILGGGFRIAFTSGPAPIIQKLINNYSHSTWSPATISQMMLLKVLDSLGMDGFEKLRKQVGSFYRNQRDALIKALEKHLTGLADWLYPSSGLSTILTPKGIKDASVFIEKYCFKHGVLCAPVCYFTADITKPRPGMRITLANAPIDQLEEGAKRLAAAIREAQKNGDA